MSKKQYKLTVEPITAVHIGNGKEITPLDYMLVKTSQKNIRFCKFSSDEILGRLINEKQIKILSEFEDITSKGNMKEMQKFFHNCFSSRDVEYLCEVTKEFQSLYNININKDPFNNASKVLQIYRQKRRNIPVIPGSSLKGAIRTAVINKLLSDVSDSQYDNLCDLFDNQRGKKGKLDSVFQKKLLGNYSDAKEDPFRCIEISDCEFEVKNSQIVGLMKNIKKNIHSGEVEQTNTIQIMAEVIKGSFMDSYGVGDTSFRLNTDLQNTKRITRAISVDDIIESCNWFYFEQFKKEYDKFYHEAVNDECKCIISLYKTLKQIVTMNSNSFILRVGRWSQVEFVTFDESFREPDVPKNKSFGKTRTIFNYDGQYLPMGWCKCTIEEVKV